MVQERDELMDRATKALLHGQFLEASTLAEQGLFALPKTTLALDSEKNCGKISLRSNGSLSSAEADCVGYCIIWLQACHETEIRKLPSPTDDGVDSEGLDAAIRFIPNYYKNHVCASMPFAVSIIWLKLIIAFRKIEEAQVEISDLLRSPDGSLYMQGQWEGIKDCSSINNSGDSDVDDECAFRQSARSRYEELVEVLLLHVLVPLGETGVARTFLDRDVALSSNSKLALYHALLATVERSSGTPGATRSSRQEQVPNSEKTNALPEGDSSKTNGELKTDEVEPVEAEELSEEDLQTLLTAGGGLLLALGFGVLAYRRRKDMFEKMQYGLRNFLKLMR